VHPRIVEFGDLFGRHRPAVLGIAFGSAALVLFLLIAGIMGRASRSAAEENEARMERRLEAARARRAAPAARIEPRRKPAPPRRPEPAAGKREYEVQVRDDDASAVPAESLPPVDAPPPEEPPGEPLPGIAPEGDEMLDPEG
jgi:hypothetical protein